MLAECTAIATALDAAHGGSAYAQTLLDARAALQAPASLPSARVLAAMREEHQSSHVRFVMAQSLTAHEQLLAEPLTAEQSARFHTLVEQSIREQKAIEAADRSPFETYRQNYLAANSLVV